MNSGRTVPPSRGGVLPVLLAIPKHQVCVLLYKFEIFGGLIFHRLIFYFIYISNSLENTCYVVYLAFICFHFISFLRFLCLLYDKQTTVLHEALRSSPSLHHNILNHTAAAARTGSKRQLPLSFSQNSQASIKKAAKNTNLTSGWD
jgi:hypothetical protein